MEGEVKESSGTKTGWHGQAVADITLTLSADNGVNGHLQHAVPADFGSLN